MKIKLNIFLKLLLIILLLIGIFDMPYEYYELLRFILMATFLWFAINEYNPKKIGWSFIFGILVLLFNPFLKLKIGSIGWKVVDFATVIILIINLVKNGEAISKLINRVRGFELKKHYINLITNKFKRNFRIIFLLTLFIIIGLYSYQYYDSLQTKKKYEIERKIRRHSQDSIQRVIKTRDSINEMRLIFLYCNEEDAIRNFKDYLKFYHPQWKLKKINQIKNSSDCVYKISCLGYVPNKRFYGTETIIAKINLNPDGDYKTYKVDIISGTFFDD
jgi:hypothetical protein